MIIEKIYFDMDGVLADFTRGIKELCGLNPIDQSNSSKDDEDALWKAVKETEHFYDRLEPVLGAMEMFRTLYNKYGDKCEILSAVPKPKREIFTAKDDKINWVRRYLSDDVVINIVLRADKKNYVKGPGCILIDDFEKNIKEWEAEGGTGILFKSAKETLDILSSLE